MVDRVQITGLGALYREQLRQEFEAEGFEVEPSEETETRAMPGWFDSPTDINAVVQLTAVGVGGVAAAVRAIRSWHSRRQEGEPPRYSKLLGPDGEPLEFDDDES